MTSKMERELDCKEKKRELQRKMTRKQLKAKRKRKKVVQNMRVVTPRLHLYQTERKKFKNKT